MSRNDIGQDSVKHNYLGEYYSITQEAKPRIETFTDKE